MEDIEFCGRLTKSFGMTDQLCYLAGPIDGVSRDHAKNWRECAMEELTKEGFSVYSPVHAFQVNATPPDKSICEKIISINERALTACDMVLANLAGNSFGTPIELQQAYDQGKRIVTFGGHGRSIYLHRFEHFYCLEQAVEALTSSNPTSDAAATLYAP